MDASVNPTATASTAATDPSWTTTYNNTASAGENHPDNSYSEAQNLPSENTGATAAVSAAASGSSVDWCSMGEATCNCSFKNPSVQSSATQEVQDGLQTFTASNASNVHGNVEGAALDDSLSDSVSESSSFSSLCTASDYSEPCPGPLNYYEMPGMSHVLTPRLMALGEEAILSYETVREGQIAGLPHNPSDPYRPRPFCPLSRENLERHFNALVDAKDAVALRQSVIEADIYDCLKMLDFQISLHRKHQVFLESAAYQIHLIKHESSVRDLGINFPVLEFFRSITQDPTYGSSFMEKNSAVIYSLWEVMQTKGLRDVRRVVDQFLHDPQSITEHRLPFSHSKALHK